MHLIINLTKTNIKKNLELCWGHLPNPNFKVFFIAVSIMKNNRMLNLGMSLDVNITRSFIFVFIFKRRVKLIAKMGNIEIRAKWSLRVKQSNFSLYF